MELIHTCLNVTDVEEAAAFYVDQLGFERSWSFESADDGSLNQYVADDDGVELQLSETAGERVLVGGSRWDHVAVAVDDVDAAFDRVDHHGVVEEPADQPRADARTAMVEDPDGHVVELVEPLE